MKKFRDLSIRTKLIFIQVGVSMLALVLFSVYFVYKDLGVFEEFFVSNLESTAEVVGKNAIPALQFLDQEAAAEVLASMDKETHITHGVIFDELGQVFATYQGHGLEPLAENMLPDQPVTIQDGFILFTQPLESEGEFLGTLMIRADMAGLHQRVRGYVVALGMGLLVIFLVILVLATLLQKTISGPIQGMVKATRKISETGNYKLRVKSFSQDETGVLGQEFNLMLDLVEKREVELKEAMETLETKVQERTDELWQVSMNLETEVEVRKKAQDQLIERTHQLEKTIEELDRFAYVASHDLKSPLRGIAHLADWIEKDLGKDVDPEIGRQLGLLKNRVHRMESLIEDLLQYSRIGRQEVSAEPISLTAFIRDVVDFLDVPDYMDIIFDDDLPSVLGFRVLLSQVLQNLIDNGIKHHPEEAGEIRITVRDDGKMLRISVKDDGPGIDPDYHEKIFGIFQILHSREKVDSTGIGLASVRKIVEGQGGTIWVESAAGAGATFHFTWPKEVQSQTMAGEAP